MNPLDSVWLQPRAFLPGTQADPFAKLLSRAGKGAKNLRVFKGREKTYFVAMFCIRARVHSRRKLRKMSRASAPAGCFPIGRVPHISILRCGKAQTQAESLVSGHDFSRAANSQKSARASAPAGCFPIGRVPHISILRCGKSRTSTNSCHPERVPASRDESKACPERRPSAAADNRSRMGTRGCFCFCFSHNPSRTRTGFPIPYSLLPTPCPSARTPGDPPGTVH